MLIGVPKETLAGEKRVGLVPESVKRLKAKGFEVAVEKGAGLLASVRDEDYEKAGAALVSKNEAWQGQLVIKVHAPLAEEVSLLKESSTLVSLLYPDTNASVVDALKPRKVTALALEKIPRTTLAQMMDVLSSQASIAGYRAVILAAEALPKLFPMMMTAAGTITPARMLVLGAGVAGLQVIATAKRLGAVVEVFDVRKVVKEQVESLGGKFIEVASEEDAQTASGYAKEVSEDYKRKQADLIREHISRADVCITTALIPGKPAPRLLDESMVQAMRPGSVIVDMAAEQGGNCALTKPGQRITTAGGVLIIGEKNLPSQMAVHASQMFSRNVEKLLLHLWKDQTFKLDMNDEITRGVVVLNQGAAPVSNTQTSGATA